VTALFSSSSFCPPIARRVKFLAWYRNQLPVGEFDMVGPTALGIKMSAEAAEKADFFRARRILGEGNSRHGSRDRAAWHARLFR
jgi:hypothetical protein